MYSVYDFGDFDSSGKMGNPYLKFLSVVDPDQASADFHQIRGGVSNTNITYIGLSAAAAALSFGLSDNTSQALEIIAKFIPPMLALIAVTCIILIICCVIWLVSFCRKRKARAVARMPRSRAMRPIPLNDTSSYIGEATTPSPSTPHVYEPVSMALTEDTFVPPSPAFHSFDSSKMRPKSFS